MLDPKEEQQYTKLRKLAQKLHVPIPEVFLELEVRDKDGSVIQRHKQRSHSWVRNAYNIMFSQLAAKDPTDATFGAGHLNLKKTNNTIFSSANQLATGGGSSANVMLSVDGLSPTFPGYRGAAAGDTTGILVGSGTDAESFEDYKLQTPIVNATLAHVASEAHSISYAALTLKNTLIRYFNNNSGAPVNVNEVGIVSACYLNGAVLVLVCRDKLASTVTIPNTGQLKVTYTIQLTYPS